MKTKSQGEEGRVRKPTSVAEFRRKKNEKGQKSIFEETIDTHFSGLKKGE